MRAGLEYLAGLDRMAGVVTVHHQLASLFADSGCCRLCDCFFRIVVPWIVG